MASVGDMAPEIEATTSGGERFKLSEFRGKKNVVLFFYPGDFTPVCTKEACSFRDEYATLKGKDTELVGISNDDDASHRKFAARYQLEYPLIADPDHAFAKQYGATGLLTTILGRTNRRTYVIDKSGRIAAVIKAELSAEAHVAGVREALTKLS